jgi:hypothetical protein
MLNHQLALAIQKACAPARRRATARSFAPVPAAHFVRRDGLVAG